MDADEQKYDEDGFSIPMDHPDHVEPAEPDNVPIPEGWVSAGER